MFAVPDQKEDMRMRPLAKAVATGALIVLLANSASAARAQTPNKPAPPASEHTAHLIEAFERQVEANRNALKIPGLSIVVIAVRQRAGPRRRRRRHHVG